MMKIVGQAALLNNMRKAIKAMDDGTLEGLQKVGEKISGDAKRIATQKDIVDTGRLRGSLTYSINGKQYGFEPEGESEHTDQVEKNTKKDEVHIGTNVEYAASHEFGSIRGIEARPYLSVAFNKNKDFIKRILGDNIMTSITKKVK